MEFEAEIVLGSRGRKPPWSRGKALLEHLLHQLRVVGHITPACSPLRTKIETITGMKRVQMSCTIKAAKSS